MTAHQFTPDQIVDTIEHAIRERDLQVADGLVTAVADEATVVTSLMLATSTLTAAAGREFEQAQRRAAASVKPVASA